MNKRIAVMEIKIEIRSKSQGNDDEIDGMTISFKGQKKELKYFLLLSRVKTI